MRVGLLTTSFPRFEGDVAEDLSRSHLRWLRNDKHRSRLRSLWAAWFEDHDALLARTTSATQIEMKKLEPMLRSR